MALLFGCVGNKPSTYEHQVDSKLKVVPYRVSNFQIIDQRETINEKGLSKKQFTWHNQQDKSSKLRFDQLYTIEDITKSHFDTSGIKKVLIKCLILEGNEQFNFEKGAKYYQTSWKVSIELLDETNKILEKNTGRGSGKYPIKEYNASVLDSLQYLSIQKAIEEAIKGV